MKKLILLFTIIVLPIFCIAQEGANAKKPTVDGAMEEEKTESSTENIKVDQTEVITKDYVKGDPIELYDLIYMLLPDEGEDSKFMKWESLNDIISVNWEDKFYDDAGKIFKKNGKAFITINGEKVLPEVELFLEGDNEGFKVIWIILDNAMGILSIDKYLEQMKPVPVDLLFPEKHFISKFIKENTESSTLLEGLYEVKFPTKNNFLG